MKEKCPSCNELALNRWRKAFASRESPLTCPNCQARLYPHVRGKGAYSLVGYGMLLASIFLTAHFVSLIPVVCGLAAIIGLDAYGSMRGNLEPVDSTRAEETGRHAGAAVRRMFRKP